MYTYIYIYIYYMCVSEALLSAKEVRQMRFEELDLENVDNPDPGEYRL